MPMLCRCGRFLHELHVALSLCIGHIGELCKNAKLVVMPFRGRGRADLCESKEPCIRWGPGTPQEGAVLRGPILTCLWMSAYTYLLWALCIVHLPSACS